MTKVTTRIIRDDYGRWVLKDNADRVKPIACSNPNCQQPYSRFIMQPLRLYLPLDIDPDSTIAARHNPSVPRRDYLPLGLNCGCYARFHRQVAHMVDNIKRRRTPPSVPDDL